MRRLHAREPHHREQGAEDDAAAIASAVSVSVKVIPS